MASLLILAVAAIILTTVSAGMNMNLALECSNRDFTVVDDPWLQAVCEESLSFAGLLEQDLLFGDPMDRRSSGGNYIRFGRKGHPHKPIDYLIGFGSPDKRDGHYMRFGRSVDSHLGKSKRDGYMRFGRSMEKEEEDQYARELGEKRFMRFGRNNARAKALDEAVEKQKKFMRFGRGSSKADDDEDKGGSKRFMRFGKRLSNTELEEPKIQVAFSGDSLPDLEN